MTVKERKIKAKEIQGILDEYESLVSLNDINAESVASELDRLKEAQKVLNRVKTFPPPLVLGDDWSRDKLRTWESDMNSYRWFETRTENMGENNPHQALARLEHKYRRDLADFKIEKITHHHKMLDELIKRGIPTDPGELQKLPMTVRDALLIYQKPEWIPENQIIKGYHGTDVPSAKNIFKEGFEQKEKTFFSTPEGSAFFTHDPQHAAWYGKEATSRRVPPVLKEGTKWKGYNQFYKDNPKPGATIGTLTKWKHVEPDLYPAKNITEYEEMNKLRLNRLDPWDQALQLREYRAPLKKVLPVSSKTPEFSALPRNILEELDELGQLGTKTALKGAGKLGIMAALGLLVPDITDAADLGTLPALYGESGLPGSQQFKRGMQEFDPVTKSAYTSSFIGNLAIDELLKKLQGLFQQQPESELRRTGSVMNELESIQQARSNGRSGGW